MWISRKKWNHLEERISALEHKEQERIELKNIVKNTAMR